MILVPKDFYLLVYLQTYTYTHHSIANKVTKIIAIWIGLVWFLCLMAYQLFNAKAILLEEQ